MRRLLFAWFIPLAVQWRVDAGGAQAGMQHARAETMRSSAINIDIGDGIESGDAEQKCNQRLGVRQRSEQADGYAGSGEFHALPDDEAA